MNATSNMQEVSDQLAAGARRLATRDASTAVDNAALSLADEVLRPHFVAPVCRKIAEFSATLNTSQRWRFAELIEDLRDALNR